MGGLSAARPLDASARWADALRAGGRAREDAVFRLRAHLTAAAQFELGRRGSRGTVRKDRRPRCSCTILRRPRSRRSSPILIVSEARAPSPRGRRSTRSTRLRRLRGQREAPRERRGTGERKGLTGAKALLRKSIPPPVDAFTVRMKPGVCDAFEPCVSSCATSRETSIFSPSWPPPFSELRARPCGRGPRRPSFSPTPRPSGCSAWQHARWTRRWIRPSGQRGYRGLCVYEVRRGCGATQTGERHAREREGGAT